MKLSNFFKITAPSPKRVKAWKVEIGEMETIGQNSDAALLTMQQKITTSFTGSYTPYALLFRGWFALAWRTPDVWEYHIHNLAEDIEPKEGIVFQLRSCNNHDTKEDCLKHLRSHLAQIAWDGIEETSPIIIEEEDQARFGRDCRWQKRYKALKQTGINDTAIRNQLAQENF